MFEDLAGLTLFDDRLEDSVKMKIVANLRKPPRKQLKRREGKSANLSENISLEDFVTSRSMFLLTTLEVDTGFLTKETKDWKDDAAYHMASQRARALSVVNDAAERGISLIQRYKTTAKAEEQKQHLLQLVHHHWQAQPKKTKAALMKKVFNRRYSAIGCCRTCLDSRYPDCHARSIGYRYIQHTRIME